LYWFDSELLLKYLILDLYSRKIIGWEVHAEDNGEHAAHLVARTSLAEGVAMVEHSKPPVMNRCNS
jgi:putative transposase